MAPDEPERPDPDGSPAPDDAAGDHPADEPRARDLIGKSAEELEGQLDPATLAELASWFMRPNLAEPPRVREVPGEARPGQQRELDEFERIGLAMGVLDEDGNERDAVREAALAAVDVRMLELFDRHVRVAETILPVRPELEQTIDETIVPAAVRVHLVGEDETAPAIGEPRTYELPRDLEDLLQQDNAPQAVLRDLNRPVEEFELRLEPAFPPPPAEEDRSHAIRDALRWRPEPVPPIERVPLVRDSWYPFLGQPWAEVVAAAKAVRRAEVEAAEAQMQAEAEAGIVWRF